MIPIPKLTTAQVSVMRSIESGKSWRASKHSPTHGYYRRTWEVLRRHGFVETDPETWQARLTLAGQDYMTRRRKRKTEPVPFKDWGLGSIGDQK